MITKIKKVYYCEFCKKRSLRKDTMIKHEKCCTLNPKRSCALCGEDTIEPIVQKYKNAYRTEGSGYDEKAIWDTPLKLQNLRDDVDNCPVCILSVIRQAKLNHSPQCNDFFKTGFKDFDYKKEIQKWYNDHRDEESDYGRY